jgi:hypothetical protein
MVQSLIFYGLGHLIFLPSLYGQLTPKFPSKILNHFCLKTKNNPLEILVC